MMRALQLSLAISAVAVVLMAATASRASAQDDDSPIESGRRSLTNRNSYPWYDAEKDELRRIELNPDSDDSTASLRDSKWEAKPAPRAPTAPIGGMGGFGAALQVLLWAVLTLVLVGVIALIARWFFRRETRQQEEQKVSQASREVDRLEQLPFAVKRPQSDLLAEARRHYEDGNFAEAIVYLFSYELVELDKHHVIRLTKGKTNRQYLGESRKQPRIVPVLEDTMIAFEDVFFGHHQIDRARFEACWDRLAEFQRGVQGGLT